MEEIKEIDLIIFNCLLYKLKLRNLDQDRVSFDEIRNILNNKVIFSPEQFAFEVFYVVCVAGFKQDYAKKMCENIIDSINKNNDLIDEEISKIYGNKLKVKAICDIWKNRTKYQNIFYSLTNITEKVNFLGTLPYVGNITKFHLARNLGLNFVKYDIWIQRLGVAFNGDYSLVDKVNNTKLLPEIKIACDIMFEKLKEITGEKVGFIDVVLWRSCQKGLLNINGKRVFINKNF